MIYCNRLKDKKGARFMWYMLAAGLLMLLIGAFLFSKPQLLWELTEKWKSYYSDEPSDFYLKSTKFGGICFAVAGLAMIIAPLVLQ